MAIADQILGHDRVTILLGDSAKNKPILASLGAGGSQPAVESVRIDECLSSNQRRAAVPDEVASQDQFQDVASQSSSLPNAGDRALAVDPNIPAIDQPDMLPPCLQGVDLPLDLGRRPQVVGIQERDQVRSRAAPTRVAGRGQACIVLSDNLDPLVDRGVSLRNRAGIVGRSIIDDDDLERAMRL